MARHSYAVYGLYVAPRMKPSQRLRVDDVDGLGLNLLHLSHGFLKNIEASPYRDEKYQQYFAVESLSPSGQRLCFGADFGRYGLEGEIRNTQNHRTTHRFGTHETAVTTARNMLLVPSGGQMALFLAERYGGRGTGSFFIRQLKAAFNAKFGGDLILHYENLIDQEAWREYLERAKLTSIRVVRYDPGHDLADRIDPKLVGRLEYQIRKKRGVQGLGQAVKERILGGTVRAQDMLGLREVHDTDETRIQLDDGNQQREIVIGQEEPPALVYFVRHDGADRPKDEVIYSDMESVAPSLCRQLHLELPAGWSEGEWSPEELRIRMEPVRGR